MSARLLRKNLIWFMVYTFLFSSSGCLRKSPHLLPSERIDLLLAEASVSETKGTKIVHLKGDPYTIGFQHGYLLRRDMEEQWEQIMELAKSRLPIPIFYRLSQWYLKARLDYVYLKMRKHILPDYRDEMRGLADGSGISLQTIHRAHALPELFSTLCANGVYFGKATADGRLYHVRNLDWSREIGVHKHACVFAVQPNGKNAFVNVGYAGFIGVLSGINEKGISVGQIGCETINHTLKGEPMPFVLKRVLEEANSSDEAAEIVRKAKRTYGYNYVFADAIRKTAVAIETTRDYAVAFGPHDSRETESGYGVSLEDALIRSDTAFDPTIRNLQTASGGNPKTPGLETPTGKAYEVRYKKQAELAKAYFGKLDAQTLGGIAKEIAPSSNIQSVIFAYPDIWIANATGNLRAVDGSYERFNVEELLNKKRDVM